MRRGFTEGLAATCSGGRETRGGDASGWICRRGEAQLAVLDGLGTGQVGVSRRSSGRAARESRRC